MKQLTENQIDDIIRLKFGKMVNEYGHTSFVSDKLLGKLFKMSQNQPKPEVVKPKQDHKLKDDDDKNYFSFSTKPGVGRDGDAKEDGDAQQKADVANASAQKVPRVRRIVGAQMLNQNGESVPMNILNSSNPADL